MLGLGELSLYLVIGLVRMEVRWLDVRHEKGLGLHAMQLCIKKADRGRCTFSLYEDEAA